MHADNIPLAVGVIVFTVFALSLGDALIKLTSSNFILWQIFVIRSSIAIPCLVLYMASMSRASLRLPTSLLWTIIRSLLLVTMWISYYIALPHIPLSVAAAALYTLPIFIALFSAALIGDTVGCRGWIAVVLGFVGVLLILKPNASDFNWYALLPLLSAVLYALAMILTRTKCREEPPLVLALALNITFVVAGSIAAVFITSMPDEIRQGFVFGTWAQMGLSQWVSMGLLATAVIIGSVGTVIAYQNAPSAVIGIFDFAYVGFAVLWSVVFFAEFPDGVSLIGMALIVLSGVLSLRR